MNHPVPSEKMIMMALDMVSQKIRNEADYEAVLARIDALMDAEAGTAEAEELDVLADMVVLYEKEGFLMSNSPMKFLPFSDAQRAVMHKAMAYAADNMDDLSKDEVRTLNAMIEALWEFMEDEAGVKR